MTRNLKALGLALVAALALGAIGAQGASAAEEHSFHLDSANETTVLTAQNEGNHVIRLGTGGGSVTCTAGTFSGTYYGNVVDTITLHPKHSSCTAFGSEITVTTGGCNYIIESDTTSGGHFSGEHASLSLECESNHAMVIDSVCKLTFKGNTVNQSLHGVTYTVLNNHSSKSAITGKATVGQLHYETSDSGGIACDLIGRPDGTYTSGIYEGNAVATAYEDPGDSATQRTGSTTEGFTWHHSTQVNISLSTPE